AVGLVHVAVQALPALSVPAKPPTKVPVNDPPQFWTEHGKSATVPWPSNAPPPVTPACTGTVVVATTSGKAATIATSFRPRSRIVVLRAAICEASAGRAHLLPAPAPLSSLPAARDSVCARCLRRRPSSAIHHLRATQELDRWQFASSTESASAQHHAS